MSRILLLDGGLGTSLEDSYSITFTPSTPLWSSHLLLTPQGQNTLLACQRDFASIPVDVLLTPTYQVSIEGFANSKTEEFPDGVPRDKIGGFLRDAVRIAECARTVQGTRLALSLGPYGACMVPGQEYSGRYDEEHDGEEALFRWNLERLMLFVREELMNRVGYVAFETIPRADEVRAVRRAVKAAGIKTPFWVSCVFPVEETMNLPDGSAVDEVLHAMLGRSVDGAVPWGVGINCTKIHKLPALVREFGECTAQMIESGEIPSPPALVIYPDGTNGEVYNTTTQKWERREDVDTKNRRPWEVQLAQLVRDAQDKGPFSSFLVGGCCKASCNDIERLRLQLNSQEKEQSTSHGK